MTTNQLLKNALDALTLYRGFVPVDQFNKSIQPVINDVRNYLNDQTFYELKSKTPKLTGFGLFDEVLKEDHK